MSAFGRERDVHQRLGGVQAGEDGDLQEGLDSMLNDISRAYFGSLETE